MYHQRRALWLSVIALLWIASVVTMLASGINVLASTGSDEGFGRLESLLSAAVAALAGAMAYIFKQWQKRDEQWVAHFIQMVHDNRSIMDDLRKMADSLERLSNCPARKTDRESP